MKFKASLVTSLSLMVCHTLGQNSGETSAQHANTLTLAQVWELDATYVDQLHGVTFHYPSVWHATTDFGYHQPALTQFGSGKPIAGFGYRPGGFPGAMIAGPYSGTDLEGVGFVYSAVPATSAAKCEAEAASLSDSPKHSKVVVAGRSFSDYETGEDFMSQSISGGPICNLHQPHLLFVRGGCGDGFISCRRRHYAARYVANDSDI